jgi:hypothetical protein
MIELKNDPNDPDKIILTALVTVVLDKIAVQALNAEITAAIRERAAHDLKTNKKLKKEIQDAAARLLLGMLGVPETKEVVEETEDANPRV